MSPYLESSRHYVDTALQAPRRTPPVRWRQCRPRGRSLTCSIQAGPRVVVDCSGARCGGRWHHHRCCHICLLLSPVFLIHAPPGFWYSIQALAEAGALAAIVVAARRYSTDSDAILAAVQQVGGIERNVHSAVAFAACHWRRGAMRTAARADGTMLTYSTYPIYAAACAPRLGHLPG